MTDSIGSNDGYDVVVIGSGPAGLSAALAAAECGASVLLCERLRQFGTKLLASGGSKCNISNTLEADAFLEAFGREGRFMKPALDIAYHDWLFPFLKSRNVPLKCDDSFHYFPRSERARDILSAFSGAIREHGGTMITEAEIQHISVNDGAVSGVIFRDGTMTGCRSVVLAGGGTAWSTLGGGRYGLDLAVELGHTLSPPLPAMAPLLIREPWVHALTGISLPDAELSFRCGRRTFRNRGELLFTHSGLSGPCAIDLAGDLAEGCLKSHADIPLLLIPDAAKERSFWQSELAAWRKTDGRKQAHTLLSRHLPRALAEHLCADAGCGERKLCELPSSAAERLLSLLTGIPLTASGAGPIDKAMAMKGGIKLREIQPDTLESRRVHGLYFAGEIMDLTGPCGGYNIQWALSSGRLAGLSAGRRGTNAFTPAEPEQIR